VRVERDGPAQAAGLRSGDVVLSVGESATAAQTYAQVRERVASAAPGERLRLRVWRQRAVTWVEIVGKTLAQQDAPAPDASGAAAPVARLGLVLAELDDSQPQRAGGLHVAAADGAAARAGILPGDRVLAVNERTVRQLAARCAMCPWAGLVPGFRLRSRPCCRTRAVRVGRIARRPDRDQGTSRPARRQWRIPMCRRSPMSRSLTVPWACRYAADVLPGAVHAACAMRHLAAAGPRGLRS
jgi:hypothetical protein